MRKVYLLMVAILLVASVAFAQKSITTCTVAEFSTFIVDKKIQLVDVRTPQEFKEGHIKGAINIDYKNEKAFAEGISKLDKKRPVAIYCRSGHRSGLAAKILAAEGFKVLDLSGGVIKWQSESKLLVQ